MQFRKMGSKKSRCYLFDGSLQVSAETLVSVGVQEGLDSVCAALYFPNSNTCCSEGPGIWGFHTRLPRRVSAAEGG